MEHPMISVFVIIILLFLFDQSYLSMAIVFSTYNVVSLGAKPDGETDSTEALMSAWAAACGSPHPAKIFVPKGRFLVKQEAEFSGQCKNKAITFRIDGSIVAPPSDYNVLGNAPFWLQFKNVNGVSIRGGFLDGQGAALWACKASGKRCPRGTTYDT